ncbi:MAG: tRNA (N6-threonylcarbamoyladenosine(37)-N6)-methyltransferase TrmO [Alteromonadaceae bacterium]|nr:tRNA (N6-threonylcarbamoyladenosine(37)-N6)-methyltransferase TrmO [Alteromonadaceae bacterium]
MNEVSSDKVSSDKVRSNKVSSDEISANEISFHVIGKVHSPYKEKFAIPRQPGLASCAKGVIELIDQANNIDLVRGLEQFSHLWVLFIFHATQQQGWKPLVRPPRLGGNKKMGVLATRSTFRPNPIGMSVVKLDKVSVENNKVLIHISGLDLLDQTPVIDIKPYLAYSDIVSADTVCSDMASADLSSSDIINTDTTDNAVSDTLVSNKKYDSSKDFAQSAPITELTVDFSHEAKQQIVALKSHYPELETFIRQVLAQDPRPAYKQNKSDDKIYGMNLYQLNITWKMLSLDQVHVIDISSY